MAATPPRRYNPAVLEFRLLGPLEVLADGEPVPLAGAKQRALLAVLLFEGGRVVSNDHLVEALWSGEPPATAQASLHNLVSQLRAVLGPDAIERRAPGYRLRLEDAELDLARVRRLVDEARPADLPRRAQLLAQALGCWRGDPLPELAYEAFARAELARLDELRLTILEEHAETELTLGRHAELVEELTAAVRAHPLRERLRGQLMLALYRAGRQAEALEVYRRGRDALVGQLGIEPSPLLQRLQTSILRQEPLHALAGTAPAPDHFAEVARALGEGRVTVVLATDAEPLATELARRFGLDADRPELPRVAQAVATLNGSGPLYDTLHGLLEQDGVPGAVHRFLASLPARLRERGLPPPLVVTTSFDLALEQALADAGEPFDTLVYVASGPHRGSFCHVAADGEATAVERPNAYPLAAGTVVLHLHGRLDESEARAWESFAVTEDDFIHYGDVAARLPVTVAARLRRSHLLLLGYSLADWTLRVVLERLFGEEPLPYRSWSVHQAPSPVEREFWRRRDVDLVDLAPAAYVAELERLL
jgi:DNA-binding SARP family transcriptional activator